MCKSLVDLTKSDCYFFDIREQDGKIVRGEKKYMRD